jgi:hypothetical protein
MANQSLAYGRAKLAHLIQQDRAKEASLGQIMGGMYNLAVKTPANMIQQKLDAAAIARMNMPAPKMPVLPSVKPKLLVPEAPPAKTIGASTMSPEQLEAMRQRMAARFGK